MNLLFLIQKPECKGALFLFIAIVAFIPASKGQQIYSDQELLDSGNYYYANYDYLNAREFIFAYIQRNTVAYQTQGDFQSSLNGALAYSIRNSSAGTRGVMRYQKTDAAGHPVLVNPPPTLKMPSKPQPVKKGIFGIGRYKCDDGGTYFIRIVNSEVWFYREPPSNYGTILCYGSIVGNEIRANWSQLPAGDFGTITLSIIDQRTLNVTAQTGGFGGTVFTATN